MNTNTKILFTTEEAAARLSIGITKTKALIRSGELNSLKIGRCRRITAGSIEDYVQRLWIAQNGVDDD
jgi:excisionase family DNA binding protein